MFPPIKSWLKGDSESNLKWSKVLVIFISEPCDYEKIELTFTVLTFSVRNRASNPHSKTVRNSNRAIHNFCDMCGYSTEGRFKILTR